MNADVMFAVQLETAGGRTEGHRFGRRGSILRFFLSFFFFFSYYSITVRYATTNTSCAVNVCDSLLLGLANGTLKLY